MERRTNTWGEMLRQLERWFGKAAYPLVFIAPNNAICLFAGAAGMPLRAFFAVNLAGTVARLWLIRRFGEERRKTKIIPHAFGERAGLKLRYAALMRARQPWQPDRSA
jgi:uncharacterized membrane protein YdjX (TVP38/TMEM64 family)